MVIAMTSTNAGCSSIDGITFNTIKGTNPCYFMPLVNTPMDVCPRTVDKMT